MSCNEWKKITLEESGITIEDGDRGKNYPQKTDLLEVGYCVFLNNKNISGDKIDLSNSEYISSEKDNLLRKGKVFYNDIILTTRGSVGNVGIYKFKQPARINSGMVIIRNKTDIFNTDFLYQLLKSPIIKEQYKYLSSGTAQPQLPIRDIKRIKLEIPPLETQEKIANILSSLDDKIELNNEMNKTLEEIAQALYKRWFVDFEFPNENGEPYKSSGGEMVESELGMIPKGWEVCKFSDISEIHDSKRIPLSKREREKRENIYPYYGAASLMDYVDDYIFDGEYILMGEDGTVVDSNGYPILQYVWGKFWVNNHAHVLTGKVPFSNHYLYLLLKNTNVSHIVTGAVQPKINQKNLNSLKCIMPDTKLLNKFNNLVKYKFEIIKNLSEEKQELEELRDTLLPKLMSGEIRVK